MLTGPGVAIFGGGARIARYDVRDGRFTPFPLEAAADALWSVSGLAVTDDGSLLAVSAGGGEFPPRNLVLAAGDGSRVAALTSGQFWEMSPSWLPDGGTLVFQSDRCCATPDSTGTYQLYAVSREGGEPWRITDGPRDDLLPVVSPDGRRIAFLRQERATADTELWVVRPDGRDARRIVAIAEETIVNALAWSGDGRSVFVAAVDVGEVQPRIARVDVDAARPVLVTVYACPQACGVGYQALAASPDGRSLAVTVVDTRARPAASSVVVVDLRRGGARALPGIPQDGVCCLAWQPRP